MHNLTYGALALCGLLFTELSESVNAAPFFYHTSFELPQFGEGSFGKAADSLKTQHPNWSLFVIGNPAGLPREVTIQKQVARTGVQALLINAAFANDFQSGVSATFENAESTVVIEADVFLKSSKRQTVWQFAAGDSGAGFVGGFNIAADNGRLQLMTKGSRETGPLVKRDVWSHFKLTFRLPASTYDVTIDEKLVAAAVPMLAKTRQLRIFQFDTFAKGDDLAYLDNFSFSNGLTKPGPPTAAAPPSPATIQPLADAPPATLSLPDVQTAEPAIKLNKDWSRRITLSSRGQNLKMKDLRMGLGGFGNPGEDLGPHPEASVFPGVPYLMPLTKAEEVIFKIIKLKTRAISQLPAACPGFPDGLFFRKYDVEAGNYSHLLIVTDRIQQVVAVNFNAKRPAPPFVQQGTPRFTPIASAAHVNNFVDLNDGGGSHTEVADATKTPFRNVVVYTVSKGQTNTWYVPQPLINLILFATDPSGTR